MYFAWLGLLNSGLPHPICSVYRFSQPLNGLLPCQVTGFISPRIHLWASILQSFPLSKSKNDSRHSFPSSRYSTVSFQASLKASSSIVAVTNAVLTQVTAQMTETKQTVSCAQPRSLSVEGVYNPTSSTFSHHRRSDNATPQTLSNHKQ